VRSHAKASSAGSTQRQGGRGHKGFAALLLAFALLGLFAAGASATVTRFPESFSPLEASDVGLTQNDPSAVAIDEATGNTFATDGFGEEGEGVVIYGEEGGAPAGLTPPFTVPGTVFFVGNTPAFLAYDNSATSSAKGTLYAYDNQGTIRKYTRNAGTEKYEEASGGLAVPGCGIGSGGGIDEEGNVYFSCDDLGKIYVFSPAGIKLHEYDISAGGQIAVDAAGDLFVQEPLGALYKFPANGFGEIEPSNYTKVVPRANGVAYEPEANEIVVAEESKAEEFNATTLAKIGEFGKDTFQYEFGGNILPSRTERVALNLKTHRAYVVDFGNTNVAVFGPDVTGATVKATAATNVTGTKATLTGSVNPEGVAVTECFFEWGETESYGHVAPCESSVPTDSEAHPVSANISGLVSNGVTYHYRLAAKNENGTETSNKKTLATGDTVITEAATGAGTSSATLHGALLPEGLEFSACRFEYKPTTDASFQQAPCVPGVAAIEPDFTSHAVSASLTELKPNSTYEFRLTATNPDATHSGKILTFATSGSPLITEIRALGATQSSLSLEAKINPKGFGTSYRIEWGTTTSYGNQVPADFEPYVGEGTTPTRIGTKLTGLAAGTTYHYRIVTTSSFGSTASPDQIAETLNSCGLPEGRCFELASRRDAGPVALPGQGLTFIDLHFQAATAGPGGLAYTVEGGYPDATNATEVFYRSTRGASGWSSTQLSAPIKQTEAGGTGVEGAAATDWLSHDLSCGFAHSDQPLTDDPIQHLAHEEPIQNLYRINPDNSYTLVTNLGSEEGVGGGTFDVLGGSQDCSKVFFTTATHYAGIPAASGQVLYEWNEGKLRNAGIVPGPSGEVPVAASGANMFNAVSEDGSRVFFTAERQTSANPAEIGAGAIFVREGGVTRDVSLSETATPDTNAEYRWATPDGSKVFFLASAGLTEESSPSGTDLYEYDLDAEKLTDLSVSHEAGGAQVGGFVAASRDGSHVYFVARAQLVPGRGKTLAENLSANKFSLYGEAGGTLSFVGTVVGNPPGAEGAELLYMTRAGNRVWSARTSSDGRYLLFQTPGNVTGYESGGERVPQAYLYDAHGGSEGTVCVSCRQDGKPSVAPTGYSPLEAERVNNPLNPPQFLTVRNGQAQVFFSSPDELAPGATVGQNNLYEWSHGQVFRLSSSPAGQQRPEPDPGIFEIVAGASEDGSDAYFVTTQSLNWEDGDKRLSIYDARIGGGYPEPAAPPAPCVPTTEGSCQGPSQGGGAVVPGATSATFSGPGNPKQTQPQQKKKSKKKSKKHTKKKGSGKQARHANGNRRAGK
jgi:hypothetical protein